MYVSPGTSPSLGVLDVKEGIVTILIEDYGTDAQCIYIDIDGKLIKEMQIYSTPFEILILSKITVAIIFIRNSKT